MRKTVNKFCLIALVIAMMASHILPVRVHANEERMVNVPEAEISVELQETGKREEAVSYEGKAESKELSKDPSKDPIDIGSDPVEKPKLVYAEAVIENDWVETVYNGEEQFFRPISESDISYEFYVNKERVENLPEGMELKAPETYLIIDNVEGLTETEFDLATDTLSGTAAGEYVVVVLPVI